MGEGVLIYGTNGRPRTGVVLKPQSFASAARRHYLSKMRPLLSVKVKKRMVGTSNASVGFTTRGNRHLFSDAVIHRSRALQMSDLPQMHAYLGSSVYVKSAAVSKPRAKDRITKFHYFKAQMHGSTVFLNVAEELKRKGNRQTNVMYLYSVTDRLK